MGNQIGLVLLHKLTEIAVDGWKLSFFSKGKLLKQFAEGQSVFFLDLFCHIYSSGRQFIVKKSCHFCMLSQLTKAAEVLTK